MENKEDNLELIQPKPYQEIGARFNISGFVPKSWLETNWGGGRDYRVFLDFIDINGTTFIGTSIRVKEEGFFSWFKNRLEFSTSFHFDSINAYFIKDSEGRINIKLSAPNDKIKPVYIPLIVRELEPKDGASKKVVEKHGKIGEMIEKYEEDLKNYYRELGEIRKSRELKEKISEDEEVNKFSYSHNWDLWGGILKLLDKEKDFADNYPYKEEDRREKELEEKYKDALRWRGPLLHGTAARLDGYEFRVYSNDHDKHFHVIHKARGINARFSFPDIKLLNYKRNPTSISSKDIKRIQEFSKSPTIFKKLEAEFVKRG